jgi:hypothetical protein
MMTLYHFTKPEFLPSIREQGLIPAAVSRAMEGPACVAQETLVHVMTRGRPVVWLTTAPDEWNGVRLTVRLEANSARLKQWAPWARRNGLNVDELAIEATLQGHTALSVEQWFVYFGTIPPTRIIAGLRATAEIYA